RSWCIDFFFSSRRRHTRSKRDWSSDVCSSDLFLGQEHPDSTRIVLSHGGFRFWLTVAILASLAIGAVGTIVPLRIGIKAFQRMEIGRASGRERRGRSWRPRPVEQKDAHHSVDY